MEKRNLDVDEIMCLVCCVLYNTLDVVVTGVLTVELPTILNPHRSNLTDELQTILNPHRSNLTDELQTILNPHRSNLTGELQTLLTPHRSHLTNEPPTILNPHRSNLTGDDNPASATEASTNHRPVWWQQSGFVLGCLSAPAVLLGASSGLIASKLSPTFLYTLALLGHALASTVLACSNAFLFLVIGAFMEGISCTFGAVCVPDFLRSVFHSDEWRCRVMSLCGLGRIFSNASGAYLTTLVYKRFGHTVAFGSLATVWILMSLTMSSLRLLDKGKGRELEALGQKDCETAPVEKENSPLRTGITKRSDSYLDIFKSWYIQLHLYHIVFIYSPILAVFASAPAQLQLVIGFTAEGNGLITGLGLLISFLVMIAIVVCVNSNFTRVSAMLVLTCMEIVGIVVYPSVQSFYLAVFCDALLHSSRNCLVALHSSLIMQISEFENLSFPKAIAVFVSALYGSFALGNYISLPLYHWMGFSFMYYSMAATLLPVVITTCVYFKLDR